MLPLRKRLCSDFDTEICYLERFNFAKSQTRTAAILLSCPDTILHVTKTQITDLTNVSICGDS